MIPIYIPHIYSESKVLANIALDTGMIAAGPFIEQFEKEMAELSNRKYAVSCANGTAALYLAIKALELPAKTEVILPSMTIVSCLTAILMNDLIPIFCDIDRITLNIDFDSAESKITKNTSAILVINTYGLMIDTIKLHKIENKYPNIKIIEDASESHGASHNKIRAGSVGTVSTFSFYTNKIVTTGEGGMVLTDSNIIYEKLLHLRNLNFIDRKKYIHDAAGFNFRMTNIQCAIGLGQLHNIENTIKERIRVALRYNKNFNNKLGEIQVPYSDSNFNNVHWYYPIIFNSGSEKIIKALEKNDIDYRHLFHPLHKQPFINNSDIIKNSEYAYANGILLPIFNELSDCDVDFISNIILSEI